MNDGAVFIFLAFTVIANASFISYGASDRALRLALGIMMLSAILSVICGISVPDLSFSVDGEDIADLSAVGEEAVREAFCKGVASAVANEFGLSASDISVEAHSLGTDTLRAEKITVTLHGRAALADIGGIRDYLTEMGLCDDAAVKISLGAEEPSGE